MDDKYKETTRDGKKVKELDCPEGFKNQDGQCVRMTALEIRNRRQAAHKKKRSDGNRQKYIDKKRVDTQVEEKLREIIREEIKNVNESGYSVIDIVYQVIRKEKPKTDKLLTIKVINKLKELHKDRALIMKLEKEYNNGRYITL